ncbi:type II secretion system protein GspG [bacterium]|nr:type II secretion system protein GspG [bacterium]
MNFVMKYGFTLIEVVLIIVIIGMLAAVGVRFTAVSINRARFEATGEEMASLIFGLVGNAEIKEKGIRTDFGYVGDCGSLPADVQGLDALVTDPGVTGWDGPYISGNFQGSDEFKRDEWGNEYIYDASAGTITSYGSDKVPGGTGYAGDITMKIFDPLENLTTNSVKVFVRDGRGTTLTDEYVDVAITYPGAVGVALIYAAGYFYKNDIPTGKQQLTITPEGIYVSHLGEPVITNIVVYPSGPASPAVAHIHFPCAIAKSQ